MSDLFHEQMPEEYLYKCFLVMEKANWHTYQILTKRPERMLLFSTKYGKIPAHIWVGTSVELSIYKHRIDVLRQVDANVRFISFEPLLGPIGKIDFTRISWAIVGGESGSQHRPMRPEWVREIRDQCIANSVAFFFKQWGDRTPNSGGRLLDGKVWDEYPKPSSYPPILAEVTHIKLS
jgi:protein gp37